MVDKIRTLEHRLTEDLKDPKFRAIFEEERLKLDLAIKIIKLRKEKRLTQAEFARRMGTSQQAISRIESGDYEGFTLKTLQKIASATGTTVQIDFKPKRMRKAS